MTIDELLVMLELIYVEVVDVSSGEKDSHGNISALPSKGLYLNLLGTEDQLINLNMSLNKSSNPQTWRQGNLVALVFIYNNKLFFLFYVTDKKALESVQYANYIYKTFKSELEQMNSMQHD